MTSRPVPRLLSLLTLSLLAFTRAVSAADSPAGKSPSILDFKVQDIDGKAVDLARFRGDVLLIVNTASKCGHTPQYRELEAVYEKYRKQGFAVLAFPANEFGHQEPGSNAEIKQFCSETYNVTFPLFSKIVVKGPGTHPLYRYLTEKTDPKLRGEIDWNFAKFLVNRKGEVVARFKPAAKPQSPEVTRAIEAALAEPK